MPRFSANLGFLFTEHPFLGRFAAARAAGFDAVEFAAPYDHAPEALAHALADHGLACVLTNLPMGDKARGDWGLACRPERVAEFRSGVARALEYAEALACPRMNCIVGRAHAGEDRALLHATLVENLRFAAAAFAHAGRALVAEALNAIDAPGFFVSRCDDMAAVLDDVGAANLGLQFDVYHAAMMGEDPVATFERHLPRIGHVQFADVPGRGEPGSGGIDFARVFRAIDRSAYSGWVGAEYRPTRATSDTLHWFVRGSRNP